MYVGINMKSVFLLVLLCCITSVTASSYTIYLQDSSPRNSTTVGDEEVHITETFRSRHNKNAKLKHATLERSGAVTFRIELKEMENVLDGDWLICNVRENHFVKVKNLEAHLEGLNSTIVINIKLKGNGIIGRTEVILNCTLNQGYRLGTDPNGTASNLSLTFPLSFRQSEKDASYQTTIAYFALLLHALMLLSVSCKFTVADVCTRVIGTGVALLFNSILEPLVSDRIFLFFSSNFNLML
jgi:hypothetical protein